jgi:hypothetical protein
MAHGHERPDANIEGYEYLRYGFWLMQQAVLALLWVGDDLQAIKLVFGIAHA